MASSRRALLLALLTFLMILALPSLAHAAGVQPRFDLSSPEGGPFPSNRWTTFDWSQKTGLRVKLPKPDCAVRPSDCADIDVLNTLDGFNLQPRISIPFTGPIDPASVDSSNVFLVRLPDLRITGINQIAWEPAANTLHVESDQLLRQHTTYVLVVTTDVRDATGKKIKSAWFHNSHLVHGLPGKLLSKVAVASIFTTQSATALLEQVRRQIKASTPSPASFVLGAGGERTVFPTTAVTSILFSRQTTTAPGFAVLPDRDAVPRRSRLDCLRGLRLAGLPDPVEGDPAGRQPDRRAGSAGDEPSLLQPLPSGGDRAGGRVAGGDLRPRVHGQQEREPVRRRRLDGAAGDRDDRDQRRRPRRRPARDADREPRGGRPVVLPAGGREVDLDGNGLFGGTDGINATPPQTLIGSRDGLRQTVIDLMQLVREVEVGMDVDGNGTRDLDPAKISYFGQSFGGIYGTKFLAVEPNVRLGVPNVPGGAIVEIARLSPSFRAARRWLSLINRDAAADRTCRDSFQFNENMPLRNLPPLVDTVPGASAIQQLLEWTRVGVTGGEPGCVRRRTCAHGRCRACRRSRSSCSTRAPTRPCRTRRPRRSSAPAGWRTGRPCSGTISPSLRTRRSRRTRTRS